MRKLLGLPNQTHRGGGGGAGAGLEPGIEHGADSMRQDHDPKAVRRAQGSQDG